MFKRQTADCTIQYGTMFKSDDDMRVAMFQSRCAYKNDKIVFYRYFTDFSDCFTDILPIVFYFTDLMQDTTYVFIVLPQERIFRERRYMKRQQIWV